MPDRRRKTGRTKRSGRIELRVTQTEQREMVADAARLHAGNVGELLRAAWREYREARQGQSTRMQPANGRVATTPSGS